MEPTYSPADPRRAKQAHARLSIAGRAHQAAARRSRRPTSTRVFLVLVGVLLINSSARPQVRSANPEPEALVELSGAARLGDALDALHKVTGRAILAERPARTDLKPGALPSG